jgi:L-threonylcarbamoyladenylate synthase
LLRPSSTRRWLPSDDLGDLIACLARGGVLAIPTESSYGLAVDPRNAAGVAAIQAIKGRVEDKGLPVVAADLAQIVALGVDPAEPALAAIAPFWPAALSVVLPVAARLPASPLAGPPSLAVRIPFHETLRGLLTKLGGALTATSANPSGQPPFVAPGDVATWLAGADAIVVDGGVLPGGLPSTLVAFEDGQARVLRAGAFPLDRWPGRLPNRLAPRETGETTGSQGGSK